MEEHTPWWRPKNDAQRAILDTLRRGDTDGYLRLITTIDLYLPQQTEDGTDDTPRSPLTQELSGSTMLLVFSSPVTMATAVAGDADCYTTTTYRALRAQLPSATGLRLAVDPGSPVATFPSIAMLDRLAGHRWRWRRRREAPPEEEGAIPTFDPVMTRLLPVVTEQADPAVVALLDAMVIAPTRWQVGGPEDLLEAPLHVVERESAQVVPAFTTAESAAEAYPELPTVRLPFLLLLSLLPGWTGMVVDPGSAGEVVLTGDRLLLTISLATDHRPAREIPAKARLRRPGLAADDPEPLTAHVTGFPPAGAPPHGEAGRATGP